MPGLDDTLIDNLDFEKALNRIGRNIKSDFIFSPHYSAIFKNAQAELCDLLKNSLRSGKYNTLLPITIEVPKNSGTTRPGSILTPIDRLLYQSVVDQLAVNADKDLDRRKVFSNVLKIEPSEPGKMFETSSVCYKNLKDRISALCSDKTFKYVIITDIACYFERIYQHVLVNLLRSTKNESGYINLLERFLSSLTQKDSHGIVQGLYPSDFLGNYYLCAFDSFLSSKNIEFVRYVDDYWMFFRDKKGAQKTLVDICSYVRKEGLYLNEAKTRILNTEDLFYEETEIDRMFNDAREEFKSLQLIFEEYSFEPFEIVTYDEDVDYKALEALYAKRNEHKHLMERIYKFCLPRLAIYKSSIAVNDAIDGLCNNPHLANIFCQYLMIIAETDSSIYSRVEELILGDRLNYEWQQMWVFGMLYHSNDISMTLVEKSYSILINISISPAIRAICALAVSKHGDGAKRRLIRNHYASEPSSYVREAIMYATKYFPSNDDKNACVNTWESHSDICKLISIAMKNETKD